ncbi:MAG: hypothetical protein NTY09_14005 [bacterium]|nr:hypothetical protein [bacterium]
MLYPRFIRWLSNLPPPFALGLLWWGETTILLCSLTGGYFFSSWLLENLRLSLQQWLFVFYLIIWFFVFYILHTSFSKNSQFFESLIHIHRLGGPIRVDAIMLKLKIESKDVPEPDKPPENGELADPYMPPEKIRASAESFKIRYFIILPATLVLYLFAFTSKIYSLFAHQIQTWEPGLLVLPALVTAIVACWCFWRLIPILPGYVSVRKLIGHKKQTGD